jgi:hypothetical protein
MEMAKRKIRARDIVNDIRAGLNDGALMEKYRLTAKGIQRILLKLLERNVITLADLNSRVSEYDDTAEIEDLRELPRNYPALPVTVSDGGTEGKQGVVRDITNEGSALRESRRNPVRQKNSWSVPAASPVLTQSTSKPSAVGCNAVTKPAASAWPDSK